MEEVLVIHNVWRLLFSSAKLALGICHSVQLIKINSNGSASDNSWSANLSQANLTPWLNFLLVVTFLLRVRVSALLGTNTGKIIKTKNKDF
jgi:hypothetical protein